MERYVPRLLSQVRIRISALYTKCAVQYKGTFQSFFYLHLENRLGYDGHTIKQTLDKVCKVPFSPRPSTGQLIECLHG